MKKLIVWQSLVIVVSLLLGIVVMLPVQAAQPQGQINMIGFTVTAKIPKNQLNRRNTFFDLNMKAGRTETLQTIIHNVTNRDIQVATAIHTASTNSSGFIEYGEEPKIKEPSLKYRMKDISNLVTPTVVTVPANATKVVTAVVSVPRGTFNGVILGGWYFERVDHKETGVVKGTMNITNQYSYAIGMKFTVGKVPSPELKLKQVNAGLLNYQRAIFPYVRNTSAVIVPGLTIQTKITQKASGRIVKNISQSNVQFAPNSVYKYPILLGKERLRAGKYHLHMVVHNQNKRWVFDRDFTITTVAARKFNRQAVDNKTPLPRWVWVLVIMGMLIIVLLITLIGLEMRRRYLKRQ